MNHKLQAFVQELADLMKRHDVTLTSEDNYDGSETFCGTEYSFGLSTYIEGEITEVGLRELQGMVPA